MLEEDGTEIDEDLDIMALAGNTFILLAKGQCWFEASSTGATSASVPQTEPTKPPAYSEHPQAPLGNTSSGSTSNIFQKSQYEYYTNIILLIFNLLDDLVIILQQLSHRLSIIGRRHRASMSLNPYCRYSNTLQCIRLYY